jgi:hypothetical protein
LNKIKQSVYKTPLSITTLTLAQAASDTKQSKDGQNWSKEVEIHHFWGCKISIPTTIETYSKNTPE